MKNNDSLYNNGNATTNNNNGNEIDSNRSYVIYSNHYNDYNDNNNDNDNKCHYASQQVQRGKFLGI